METAKKPGKDIVNGFGSLSKGSTGKASNCINESFKTSNSFHMEDYEAPPGAEKQNFVSLEDLENFVSTMISSEGFKEHYKVLKSGPLKPWSHGQKPENKSKNRYNDLIPYDDNRVILNQTKNHPSDYINASYIDSYSRKKAYICTQGPLENTVVDFWRMVWQEDVNVIVMIASVLENGKKKCEKYWPESRSKYSDMTVTILKEEGFLDYTIRIMKIRKAGTSKSRIIRQYQYTGWPDHGVPKDPLTIIYLMQDVAEYQRNLNKTSPVLLHCSAGAGRSGTTVALMSALEMIEAEGRVDLLGILYKMRQQRVNVIGAVEQYIFVHEALVHYHFGDVTRRPSGQLVLYFNKLRQTDQQARKTGLMKQFEHLRSFVPADFKDRCTVGLMSSNANKNRYSDIIPPNDGRPILKSNPPSNYINAVYVHDYGKCNQFIATQFPLPNTIPDFWQMLYDVKASTVIVLNEISRNDEESPMFWPVSGNMFYGNFKVENVTSESEYINGVLARKLKIRNAKGSLKCHTVKMFELYGWCKKEHIPPQRDFIINLLNRVQQWCRKSGPSPIIVTCFDGYTASGFYCAASYIAGQVKSTENVDVFQAVRTIRLNRTAFVPNVEQYRWLYEIACSLVTNKKLLK